MNDEKFLSKTILRKITLYKHLASKRPDEMKDVNMAYRCFGEIDGLDVELLDYSNIDVWMDTIKTNNGLLYLREQKFYVVRQEKEGDRKDEIFWSEVYSLNSLVLLVSFICLSPGSGRMDAIRKIEEKYGDKVRGYFGLELSDIILFIIGDSYKDCDETITHIRYQDFASSVWSVTYSYSIPAIPAAVFDKNSCVSGYSKEMLKRVDIMLNARCVGEQTRGAIDFEKNLKNVIAEMCPTVCIESSSILGDYDIHLELSNITMAELLTLYKEGEILCRTNKIYQDQLFNCITKIHA